MATCGTQWAYRQGCRCPECRAAKAEGERKRRRRLLADGGANFAHGLYGYKYRKCRCDTCKAAQREYRRERADAHKASTPPVHGVTGYGRYGCRCEVCVEAGQRMNAAGMARVLRLNARMPKPNGGKEWTGPELEIAARTDLSAREAALMLGRSYKAVEKMREKIKRDPRKSNLAGLRRDAS